jgi:hypothetical protein
MEKVEGPYAGYVAYTTTSGYWIHEPMVQTIYIVPWDKKYPF